MNLTRPTFGERLSIIIKLLGQALATCLGVLLLAAVFHYIESVGGVWTFLPIVQYALWGCIGGYGFLLVIFWFQGDLDLY